MSTTVRSAPRSSRGQSVSPPRHRAGKARNVHRRTRPALLLKRAEASRWAYLEDREEGRIALEADHLFDTSYAWAA